jgi:chromosome segregation ATPase
VLTSTSRSSSRFRPTELAEHTAVEMNESVENLESLRAKKEKLVRERENIGAVNLRADEEYANA